MSDDLTIAEVQAIATLAQLELDPAELHLFARQLGEILQFAKDLQSIDTSGVPPTASIGVGHEADRADELGPSLDRAAALANAPDGALQAGLFRVPRVIG